MKVERKSIEDFNLSKIYKNILDFLCNHWDLNFFLISKDGDYLLNSSKMKDILGEGVNRADLFDEKSWLDCLKIMESKETKSIEEKYEGKNKKYDGHWFLSIKSPFFYDGNVEGVIGFSIDITERKNLENQLTETKERLEHVLDTIPGHVYWKDTNGAYLGCNTLQAKNSGLSKEEIIGKTDHDLLPKEIADKLRKVDLEVIDKKEPKTVEESGPVLALGGEERVFLSRKVPLFDSHDKNKIIGLLGVSLDITEQKKTEQELLEIQHKLEGMTLVSASIAHELRTPLQSLALGVDGIKKYLPTFLEAYQLAEENGLLKSRIKKSTLALLDDLCNTMNREISLSALTIDMLLMNLKTEIGNQQNLSEEFSIISCIDNALNRYPFSTEERQLISWNKNSGRDFLVRGSEVLLSHVLFNLIKNAFYHIAKAQKGGIMIWIETTQDTNCLIFKDTGTGIEKEMLPLLFNRFVSGNRHGAGVGLAFSKMVMESFGGKITCESKKNIYTLFKLFFPKKSGSY